jgi:hypothetical protein
VNMSAAAPPQIHDVAGLGRGTSLAGQPDHGPILTTVAVAADLAGGAFSRPTRPPPAYAVRADPGPP